MNNSKISKVKTRLLISDSEQGADMFYATGFRAPDPFVYLEHHGKKIILLNDLEIDRGCREAKVDEVVSWSAFEKEVTRQLRRKPTYEETLAAFLKNLLSKSTEAANNSVAPVLAPSSTSGTLRRCAPPAPCSSSASATSKTDADSKKGGVAHLIVPASFPLSLARALEKVGLVLETQEGLFFPERIIKKPEEIKLLKRATHITEIGMARAIEILKESTIGKRHHLYWGGRPLTSERLRQEVEGTMYRAGGLPAGDSIIAGGLQACDPHERGHGILQAHQLIILDLFPRDARSGYYGDLTRTIVRGTASNAQRDLWETCLKGQQLALKKIKPGAFGKKIHEAVQEFFTQAGYPTEQRGGRWSGFFHGTGHGLGLELHEEPRFGAATLKTGNVFTIEPGLYIPGLGGVRHEDVVAITSKGYQLLSRFPKMLEI